MVNSCCMVGCTNKQNKEKGISLHRIPQHPPWRREAWIKAINRLDPDADKPTQWVPTQNSRVCSIHFLEGKPNEEPSHPDFVPSQNIQGKTHQPRITDSAVKRHERAKRRYQLQENTTTERETSPSLAETENAASSLLALSQSSPFKKAKEPQTPALQEAETIRKLQKRLQQSEKSVEYLRKKNAASERKLERIRFSTSNLPDHMYRFYTGISKELFQWLVAIVRPHAKSVKVIEGMLFENHLLLVLVRIRLGLLTEDLAQRFGISSASVSRVWNSWVPLVANCLRPLIAWPERDVARANIPASFKPLYGKVVSIIDCFEVFIERPHNLTARAQTWSNYKHNNTTKYLISITPAGAINFLSAGWGGRVSDKEITLKSGYMDKLLHGDEVLADRGFLVSEEMAVRGVTLRMPSFTKGKKQLSAKEVDSSRKLAHVRIHVERVIGHMKTFLFLQTSVPVNQLHLLDDIVTIVGALHNLLPSIVTA